MFLLHYQYKGGIDLELSISILSHLVRKRFKKWNGLSLRRKSIDIIAQIGKKHHKHAMFARILHIIQSKTKPHYAIKPISNHISINVQSFVFHRKENDKAPRTNTPPLLQWNRIRHNVNWKRIQTIALLSTLNIISNVLLIFFGFILVFFRKSLLYKWFERISWVSSLWVEQMLQLSYVILP